MKTRMSFSLLAGLICCLALNMTSAAQSTKPNILLCIADDHGWPDAGAYGNRVLSTPNIDRIAREGILFNNAFSCVPSCTPSRAAILTGQYPHRLEDGANLWGTLDKKYAVYPDLLEQAGYVVGMTRKGWAPGNFKAGGRTRNPAGPTFKDFETFLESVPADKPFCFWFGSTDPHRPYTPGAGLEAGLNTNALTVPPIWPDVPEVRNDILDYYDEVQRFDRDVGKLIAQLEAAGKLDNTLVVVTGDNGRPFPRAKANLYDVGTHQLLVVRAPAIVKAGQTSDAFINLMDLAPTFLEIAGIKPPSEMTGRSLVPIFKGSEKANARDAVFLERERHANVRKPDLGYPCRAIRTKQWLYIRNFAPDRWPAGDPEKWKAVGPFGDVDDGPTKQYILKHRDEPGVSNLFRLAFAKRPAEELYSLNADPYQTNNLADVPAYTATLNEMRTKLQSWMKTFGDPRASGGGEAWDKMPYYGNTSEPDAPTAKKRKK